MCRLFAFLLPVLLCGLDAQAQHLDRKLVGLQPCTVEKYPWYKTGAHRNITLSFNTDSIAHEAYVEITRSWMKKWSRADIMTTRASPTYDVDSAEVDPDMEPAAEEPPESNDPTLYLTHVCGYQRRSAIITRSGTSLSVSVFIN
jgi:hypothetical protein